MIEYVLLSGVNDTLPVARELGELLKGKKVTVNLIPYNSTDVSAAYRTPPREDILAFQTVLKEYHLATTIRKEMGPDIAAACGQLVVSKSKEEAGTKVVAGDIEDMSPAGHGAETGPESGVPKLADDGRPIPSKRLWPLKHMSKKKKNKANAPAAMKKGQESRILGIPLVSIFVLIACVLFVPLIRYTDGLAYLAYVADIVARK